VIEAVVCVPWDDVEVHVEHVLAAIPLVVLQDRDPGRAEGGPHRQRNGPQRGEDRWLLLIVKPVQIRCATTERRDGGLGSTAVGEGSETTERRGS
jgi:hypothetical protein